MKGIYFIVLIPNISHTLLLLSLFFANCPNISKVSKLLPFAQPLKTSNSFYMPFARRGFLPLLLNRSKIANLGRFVDYFHFQPLTKTDANIYIMFPDLHLKCQIYITRF